MGVVSDIERFDVFLVALDPTRGSEISTTRPCAVVSPDEMNRHVRTVIVAPMTTASRAYPTRVAVRFQGKGGRIALDQIRTVDKARLLRRLGPLPERASHEVARALVEMFRPD